MKSDFIKLNQMIVEDKFYVFIFYVVVWHRMEMRRIIKQNIFFFFFFILLLNKMLCCIHCIIYVLLKLKTKLWEKTKNIKHCSENKVTLKFSILDMYVFICILKYIYIFCMYMIFFFVCYIGSFYRMRVVI